MTKEVYSENIGDLVLCDFCNKNFTGDNETKGGIIFGSKGVCPVCTKKMMPDIKKYDETFYIKAKCPENTSFWKFILDYRRGKYGSEGDMIRVLSGNTLEDLVNPKED